MPPDRTQRVWKQGVLICEGRCLAEVMLISVAAAKARWEAAPLWAGEGQEPAPQGQHNRVAAAGPA